MKKAGALLFSALFAISEVLSGSAQAAPEYTLSLNLPIPPIHTRWQGPLKAWVDEVEKRSGGRLKIEPYFAEALSPRSEAFESVKSGIADITECAYEANSGQFPFHEGILSISSPSLFLGDGTALVKGMYEQFPQVLEELDGVKLLFTHACGSLSIATTKKPVRTLEDLKGLKQLPGLAAQLLMRDGYSFGAEGDWKTSALTRLLKIMAHNDRTVFMEDYTLDLRKGHEAILGAHMLEVDPTIASDKPRVEVHPLDIGGKDDPARLVFTGADGEGIDCTVADFRDGFRLISYPVDCRKAEAETPHLPVAKQLWTPKVGLKKGATAWIHAGGGHHTVLSFRITEEQIHDLGTMLGMNLVESC